MRDGTKKLLAWATLGLCVHSCEQIGELSGRNSYLIEFSIDSVARLVVQTHDYFHVEANHLLVKFRPVNKLAVESWPVRQGFTLAKCRC